MAQSRLDGAGTAKMETLDEASTHVVRLHSVIERMAEAIRSGHESATFTAQLRRTAAPLVGLLKGQFGTISDQVTAMLLVASRGGGEQMKIRMLRESLAQIRVALEIAVTKVNEKHGLETLKTAPPPIE
jgi:hypothetical protein